MRAITKRLPRYSPSGVCPASISFGETVQCSIDTPGEIDTYTFSATAGDKVLVRMGRPSGNLWPEIIIKDTGGIILCDDYDTITAEIISCSLSATGTYSILADDYLEDYTGDYYLYLQRLNNPGSPTAIAFGQTLPGSITTAAEMDSYTFSATAGDKVLVRMGRSSGNLWPEIRIYGPDGVMVCDDYDTITAEIASCSLVATGTHTILAYDGIDSAYTGDYYLYLQRLNNPGSPTAIAFGQTLPGSIITPAEMDSYTFSATAGDKVLVRMGRSSGNLWPEVRIYGPDGVMVCDDYDSITAEIASCTLSPRNVHHPGF